MSLLGRAPGWLTCTVVALASIAPAYAGTTVRWDHAVTVASDGAGWGRLALQPDGRWIAVTTRFGAGSADTTLELRRSDDAGRTWHQVGEVAEPGRRLDNGQLLALPDGRVLLAMRSLVEGRSYRLEVYDSPDAGAHWRLIATPAANEAPAGRNDRGVWEPLLSLLPDGSLSLLYADETLAAASPGYSQVIAQRLSRDGGRTWEPRQVVVAQPGGGALRPGMPGLARLDDGRFMMVFEICGDDPQCPVSMKLSDDGVHWPKGLGAPVPGQRCGPSVASSGATVLAISCQNQLAASTDAGQHWQSVDPPWPAGFRHSWPAVFDLGGGRIGVINNVGRAVQLRVGTLSTTASP